MAGPCSPKHDSVPFMALKNLIVWILCSHLKTFYFMVGPRSPTYPVTAQLISRRWRIVSSSCYADFPQRSNEPLVVLPQKRSNSFHGVEKLFRLHGIKFFENNRTYGCTVLPKTGPSFFHGVEKNFRLDVMQLFKNDQIHVRAAIPNIFCHGPAHFAELKNFFILMLCKLSTTFNWTAGRAPPNTVQLISRCSKTFLIGWYEAFQKQSN